MWCHVQAMISPVHGMYLLFCKAYQSCEMGTASTLSSFLQARIYRAFWKTVLFRSIQISINGNPRNLSQSAAKVRPFFAVVWNITAWDQRRWTYCAQRLGVLYSKLDGFSWGGTSQPHGYIAGHWILCGSANGHALRQVVLFLSTEFSTHSIPTKHCMTNAEIYIYI